MHQKTIILGRLGRDPEMFYTKDNVPYTKFSMAIDDGWGDRKKTVWFRVVVFRNQAESCAQYLHKGDTVYVEGTLDADPATGGPKVWTGKDGAPRASYEMVAREVKFVNTKRDGDTERAPEAASRSAAPAEEDDFPF